MTQTFPWLRVSTHLLMIQNLIFLWLQHYQQRAASSFNNHFGAMSLTCLQGALTHRDIDHNKSAMKSQVYFLLETLNTIPPSTWLWLQTVHLLSKLCFFIVVHSIFCMPDCQLLAYWIWKGLLWNNGTLLIINRHSTITRLLMGSWQGSTLPLRP